MHVLMVKQVEGFPLKYLCKTSSRYLKPDDLSYAFTYKGSGKRWLNHVKAHPGKIVTTILGVYNSREDLRLAGLAFSKENDVVESDEWANLTEEKGDGGFIGIGQLGKHWKMSLKARANVSKAQSARRKSEPSELRKAKMDNIRGTLNYQSKYRITTPWGIFYTFSDATTAAKNFRAQGRDDVISDIGSLINRLQNLDQPFNTKRIACKRWRNMTPRELGFNLELKDDNSIQ